MSRETQLYRRQLDAGASPRAGAALLRRRGLWMIAFGVCHTVLLLSTDVLGAWGLLTVVLSLLFLRRGDRTLAVWCWIGVACLALMVAGALMSSGEATLLATPPQQASALAGTGETNYLVSAVIRLSSWIGLTLITVVLFTAPFPPDGAPPVPSHWPRPAPNGTGRRRHPGPVRLLGRHELK